MIVAAGGISFQYNDSCRYLSLETSVWIQDNHAFVYPLNTPAFDEWSIMILSILQKVSNPSSEKNYSNFQFSCNLFENGDAPFSASHAIRSDILRSVSLQILYIVVDTSLFGLKLFSLWE